MLYKKHYPSLTEHEKVLCYADQAKVFENLRESQPDNFKTIIDKAYEVLAKSDDDLIVITLYELTPDRYGIKISDDNFDFTNKKLLGFPDAMNTYDIELEFEFPNLFVNFG